MPDDQILIICVHYRRPAETEAFTRAALDQKTEARLTVLVVDNSPEPRELAVPDSLRHMRCVRVFDPGRNLGYFGGADYALKDHLKSNPLPTWVIISNPDIQFVDDGVLERLIGLHRGKEPGVIAPSIRSVTSGIDQNPYMRHRPSKWRMRFYRWMFSAYPTDAFYQTMSWIAYRIKAKFSANTTQQVASRREEIYAPHGSFVPLHRSYFERGGNLDYAVVLFGEEIFVGETARRLGLTVLHEPQIKLRHQGHTSMGGIWNRDIANLRKRASRYLAENFF